jgi:lipid II:glycine glycyltransferase (peptidoglycan interpeptide bridge formation enzyme)
MAKLGATMTGGATALDATTLVRVTDPQVWLRGASSFQDYGYRQAWAYTEAMAARAKAVAENVAVRDRDGETIAMASVRVKRLPLVDAGIAYISGGPLMLREASDPKGTLAATFEALYAEYVSRRNLTLRIAPPPGPMEWSTAQSRFLAAHGSFGRSSQPASRTILLDLERTEDEIRAALAKKWRSSLNRSERAELTVRAGTDGSLFRRFIPLFDELIRRKAFTVDLGPEFFVGIQDRLAPGERLIVLLAEDAEGVPVAGVVVSVIGSTAVYLLGAANDRGRETQASYLLQWEAIRRARSSGCRWYDLGGVDPEGNPGVYQFKTRMGGVEVEAPGPFEAVPSGPRARMTASAEWALRQARSVRAG